MVSIYLTRSALFLAISVVFYQLFFRHQIPARTSSMPTNLSPATITGSVSNTFTITINAPVSKVWDILTDLPNYPLWNPSMRFLVMVDDNRQPLDRQELVVGKSILVGTQINASMDPANKPRGTLELVIEVDHERKRWAYRSHGTGPLFRAERAQAVMDLGGGVTQWEIRHTVGGVGGAMAGMLMGEKLKSMLEETGKALKKRAEEA